MGLIAAMLMTGCAGKAGAGAQAGATQTDAAQTEATAVEEKTETEAGAGQEAAAPETVKYESTDGWSAVYEKNSIEVIEDDGVYFSYIGKADGVNQINVKYYADQMPDEVLYNVMADENGLPEHTRSEGYFGKGTDVWALRTSMTSVTVENAAEDFIAVERNGGTLLVQITTTKQADEMTGMGVSDALSAVLDSFELKDQQPQTYSANVPGKYVAQSRILCTIQRGPHRRDPHAGRCSGHLVQPRRQGPQRRDRRADLRIRRRRRHALSHRHCG